MIFFSSLTSLSLTFDLDLDALFGLVECFRSIKVFRLNELRYRPNHNTSAYHSPYESHKYSLSSTLAQLQCKFEMIHVYSFISHNRINVDCFDLFYLRQRALHSSSFQASKEELNNNNNNRQQQSKKLAGQNTHNTTQRNDYEFEVEAEAEAEVEVEVEDEVEVEGGLDADMEEVIGTIAGMMEDGGGRDIGGTTFIKMVVLSQRPAAIIEFVGSQAISLTPPSQ